MLFSLISKLSSLDVFNAGKILPHGLDEFLVYTNLIFQPFGENEDHCGSSDSPPAFLRNSLFSQVEVKSSNTIVMPVMVTETANLEEQLADMKVTLHRLLKERAEKDVQIKR